jgi:diguanylate cyclase (GGDEF)-like protein
MNKTKILLVQNARTQGNSTKRSLDCSGYDVIWVGSGVSALAAAKQGTIDLVIIDVALPDIEGGDLYRLFRSRENMKTVPIILLAPREYAPLANDQNGSGPDVYLAKPYSDSELTASITIALSRQAPEKTPPLQLPIVTQEPEPHADTVMRAERSQEPQSAPREEQQSVSAPQLRPLLLAEPRAQAGPEPEPVPASDPKPAARPQQPVVTQEPEPHADTVMRAERSQEPQSAPREEQRSVSAPQLRPLQQAEPRAQAGPAPTPEAKQSPDPVPASDPKPAARPQLQLVRKAEPMPAIQPADEPPAATPQPALPPEDEVVDPSTGLFSRKQFEAMFSKDFKRAVRFKQQLSCMIIDLDGRKIGRAGDEATLKSIIGLVQQTIREVDTAAWWTGKELIILLPNTIRNDALQAAMRILETVANHPFTWADATKVTMSIGVAGLPDRFIDTEQKLIESAAMACKRAGDLMRP